ncbi:hypothetical protein [Oceanibacterium hippocampi]|uniref:Uncharacterized protein n=1 Tax=Oceanibacterium hippocampi TaxID=745714 RepID=A0A1Y5SQS4_9PROT|nr:hypothetical protein [Oceanibacterium hippocampi]SLN46052.1 hypothetical protein OCH7691_01976 [Oceanibacterium hippocampi]
MFEISRISSNPDGFLVRYHGPGKLSEFRLALRRIAELTTPGGPTMILSIVEKDAAMAIDETEFDSVGARRLAVEMSSLLAAIGPGRSASVLSEDFAFAVARMYGT